MALLFIAGLVFVPVSQATSIGGFIWNDANRNGLQDFGEVGITNVQCWLQDQSLSVVSNTLDDSTGHYVFANLTNGCYKVVFQPLTSLGYEFTLLDAGPDDTDSDASNTASGGFTSFICITNTDVTHVDAGYYRLVPNISLSVRAGSAPAGTPLYVTSGANVVYSYEVTNNGETHLTPVLVQDLDLGTTFVDISPPEVMAPGDARTATQIVHVTESATNAIVAIGFAANFKSIVIPGIDPVYDVTDVVVVVVPNGDTDGDGLPDLTEYQIGTDPNDPHSYLPREGLMPPNARVVSLLVDPSSTGRVYRLFAETNLLHGPQSWNPYGPFVTGTGSAITFVVTNDVPVRFYRTAGFDP